MQLRQSAGFVSELGLSCKTLEILADWGLFSNQESTEPWLRQNHKSDGETERDNGGSETALETTAFHT
jgi:hypothetical protein